MSTDMNPVEIYPDPAVLARAAAERVITLAADAITTRGRFSLGLSGGSTPRALFSLLASDELAARLDWTRGYVFWGDERCVPPDHPDSNYRMARAALLDRVPVPAGQIHRMRGEIEPVRAAAEYEHTLRAFFAQEDPPLPSLDVLLLGMGDDGHTASLFPGTRALQERTRWVLENYVPRLAVWRLTLTPVALNAAANVIFLAAGESKAETLAAVLKGPRQPEKYPSQLIQPGNGSLTWMVDQAAAARL